MLPQTSFRDVAGTDSRMPVRTSATQFLLLDSADRNQQSQQPWNNFSFQKPQALIDAFADRVLVTEVVFPWFIPNITEYNNSLWIGNGPDQITIPVGFYTPTELVTAINAELVTAGYPNLVLSYDLVKGSGRYTFTNGEAFAITGIDYKDPAAVPNSVQDFTTTASLFKTLGFSYAQSGVTLLPVALAPDNTLVGQSTLSQYTAYVDIISNRLMRYTSVKDGESASNAQSAVICRVYATDETSTPAGGLGFNEFIPQTSRPFVIHRQFKTPKAIQWTRESFIDYLDIKLVDQWNNLVPLPTLTAGALSFLGSYPDWQLSLLCSED